MKERNVKEKSRHDRTANEELIEVGDKVILKNKQKAKGQPKYDPEPYEVVQIHGRQTLLRRGDRKIWRETQKFKKIAPQTGDTSYHGGETDEWEESRDRRYEQNKDSDNWEPEEEAIQEAEREQEIEPGIREQDRQPDDESHRPQRQRKPPDWYGTWTE